MSFIKFRKIIIEINSKNKIKPAIEWICLSIKFFFLQQQDRKQVGFVLLKIKKGIDSIHTNNWWAFIIKQQAFSANILTWKKEHPNVHKNELKLISIDLKL